MSKSTAKGLRGGGALLAGFSLLLPWYVVEAQGFTGLGKSGLAALGGLSWLVLVLAIAAGSTLGARIHRLVPVMAGGGLLLLVVIKIASPPAATQELIGASRDPLTTAIANAVTEGLGVGYRPAWGIWVAAVGAAIALLGAVVGAHSASGSTPHIETDEQPNTAAAP